MVFHLGKIFEKPLSRLPYTNPMSTGNWMSTSDMMMPKLQSMLKETRSLDAKMSNMDPSDPEYQMLMMQQMENDAKMTAMLNQMEMAIKRLMKMLDSMKAMMDRALR